MFCSTCGIGLAENARFCSDCGSRQDQDAGKPEMEVRDFLIPVPQVSPFARMTFKDSDRPFTRKHLAALGISNPSHSDYYLHPALSHVWYYFADHVKGRVEEMSEENWEPKADPYGVLTTQAIRERIVVDKAPAEIDPTGRLLIVRGFSIRMRREARIVESENPAEGP